MKTNLLTTIGIVLLIGCASLETNTYKVIGSTATAVDVGMKAWADQVVRRNISYENQQNVRQVYKQYQQSMFITSNAVMIYKATGDKQQLTAALNSLSFVSGQLLNLLQPPVPTPPTVLPQPTIFERLPTTEPPTTLPGGAIPE